MGIRCILVDHTIQVDCPVGDDCISVVYDVTKMDLRRLVVDFIQASPPCPPTSTAPAMGRVASKEPQLIPITKSMLSDLNSQRKQEGLSPMPWILENVASSGDFMNASMITDGCQIGSRVNRKRMLEMNFVPNCELSHSLQLCLGDRAKWPRTDKDAITME